jgi:CRISPR-associated endonuclease/helicase Cas3
MRVLVEQTRDVARGWLEKVGLRDEVQVHVLMGGEDTTEWDLHPEKSALLIGTQDMLLSRALNRGYGMSRYRWPMHFGLLNNDILWVLDEIQLMGVGLATSAQLQGFRERFGAFGPVRTVWMSATLRPRWLETVDFRDRVPDLTTLSLTEADYKTPGLDERWNATKPISVAGLKAENPERIAVLVKEKHLPGSLTLVVVNTVDRSRALFDAVRKLYRSTRAKGRGKKPTQPAESSTPTPELRLIHSRFRPMERESWMGWLKQTPPPEGRIVISTQVVEAGVDMSARTVITELAPWPSLVQRLGRCNRRGEFKEANPAGVYWIDVPAKDDKQAAPYAKAELDEARRRLKELADGGPRSLHVLLESLPDDAKESLFPFNPPHILRRKDFVDLFDTTPDLAGNDIDVSRFIREGDELDVQVFWRSGPPPRVELDPREARRIAPMRTELCPVPVAAFRAFLDKAGKQAFRWDALDGQWLPVKTGAVFPGQVFWVDTDQGGYSRELGWDPRARWEEDLEVLTPSDDDQATSRASEPEYDSDLLSLFGWRSIAEHTDDVIGELEQLARSIDLKGIPWAALGVALRWHDWGKAHRIFQSAIKDEPVGEFVRPGARAGQRDIAKATPAGFWRKYGRRHFRHELASAIGVLSLLRNGAIPPDWSELSSALRSLALYLIAAHHGKVRLSIRSMPDERKPDDPERLFARGIYDGETLPGVDLGGGVFAPECVLDLSPMKLGRGSGGAPSWAERMLGLRDHPDLGPLRLAYLEAVVRAADSRASIRADQKARR